MIDNIKIGQRIAMLRKEKGFTQEEIADELGVTGQAVSKWENGNALPDLLLLPQLAGMFEISIDRLLSPNDLYIFPSNMGL
ncbi:MAG TPA: helix-turn-helix transcriptional regulator [Bacillota bacterium]